MNRTRGISLGRRSHKKFNNVVRFSKQAPLAKVLFGPAHSVVAQETIFRSSGATVHELSVCSGLRYEITEYILIDLHRAGLGTLENTVYKPTNDVLLNKAIDGIACAEFIRSLNGALDGFGSNVPHQCGAADPMKT